MAWVGTENWIWPKWSFKHVFICLVEHENHGGKFCKPFSQNTTGGYQEGKEAKRPSLRQGNFLSMCRTKTERLYSATREWYTSTNALDAVKPMLAKPITTYGTERANMDGARKLALCTNTSAPAKHGVI